MTTRKFVKVIFEVHCNWEGFAPEYRIYVNDELFTERTFSYSDEQCIRETLQVEAEPGEYEIRLEKQEPSSADFSIHNSFIKLGPGSIIDDTHFRIL